MVEVFDRRDVWVGLKNRPKDYERAVVVDAEVNKEQGRPLFGVHGEVRSKKI
jgi:hypothetical protein